MNCYVCGKEYKSWSGLFYHKKNVHGSNVRSKPYDRKMEAKEREKLHDCLHCSNCYCAKELEEHYKASHRQHLEFIFCRICSSDCRREIFKDHIRAHNIWIDIERIKKAELDKLFETSSSAGCYDSNN